MDQIDLDSADLLDIVLDEIEDLFSITLQYYYFEDFPNGDLYLNKCIKLIDALAEEPDIDRIAVGKYLTERVEELYKNKDYTIYLA